MNVIVYIDIILLLLELSIGAGKNDDFNPEDFVVEGKQAYDLDKAEKYFDIFNYLYEKQYDRNEVYNEYFKIFKDNLQTINNLNKGSETSAIFKINEFTDWPFENFTANYTGFNMSMVTGDLEDYVRTIDSPPLAHMEVNWRNHKVVSPVKNQGACSSSYVYSTLSNIESQHALRHGYLYEDLSIKQGFECEPTGTCETGGVPHHVMEKFMEAGGVVREDKFYVVFDFKPKDNHKGPCNIGNRKVIAKIDSFKYFKINQSNEDDLADAVFNLGPIVVSMYVSPSIQHYRSGVLDPVDCNTNHSNHAVLLVGFGKDPETHEKYWLIKNSWGMNWGEYGYLRLIKDRYNGSIACNLGKYAATVNAAFNPTTIKTTRITTITTAKKIEETNAINASASSNETVDNETITLSTTTSTTTTTTTTTTEEPVYYDSTYNWDFSQTTPDEEYITINPVDPNLDNNKTESDITKEPLDTETSNNTDINNEHSDTETSINNTQSDITKEPFDIHISNNTQSNNNDEPSNTETSNNTQSDINNELSADTEKSNNTQSDGKNEPLDIETSNNTQSNINNEPSDTETSNNIQPSQNLLFRVSKTFNSRHTYKTPYRYRTPIYEFLDNEYLRSSRVVSTPESWDKFTARLWHETTTHNII